MPFTPTSGIDPELLNALGEMVIRFSALEESLRDAIWSVNRSADVVVQSLTVGLNFSTLIDKFGAIYYEHYPAHRADISALCAHPRSLNEKRNTLIHSFWYNSPGSTEMVRHKITARSKHGLELRAEGVLAATVRALSSALADAEDKGV